MVEETTRVVLKEMLVHFSSAVVSKKHFKNSFKKKEIDALDAVYHLLSRLSLFLLGYRERGN